MNLPSKRKLIPIAVIVVVVLGVVLWVWVQKRNTEQLIQAGMAALQAKDWGEASEKLAQAKLRVPNHPDVVYGLAKANLELALQEYQAGRPAYLNRLRQVEGQLDHLQRVAGERPEAALVRGDVFFYLDRPETALRSYQEVLKRQPNSYEAQLGVGRSLYALAEEDPSRRAQAIEALQKALQINRNSETALQLLAELYVQQGDLAAASPIAEALEKLGHPLSGKSLKTVGKVLFFQGQYEKAKGFLLQAVDKIGGILHMKDLVENRYLLGTTCFYLRDLEGARTHLNQAAKSSEKESYPLIQLSQLLTFQAVSVKGEDDRKAQQMERAMRSVEEASRREPQNPTVLYLLAHAYVRLDRFPEARDTLMRLVGTFPDNVPARFDLAGILYNLGDDIQAIRHYQEILKRDPQLGKASFNLGSIFLKRAGYTEAIAHLEQAVHSAPELIGPHLNLAQAYLGRGALAKAQEQYEAALQLHPGEIQALLGLGMIHQRQGDMPKAQEYFRDAVRMAPASDTAHVMLARSYAQQGDLLGAIRELERVLSINPQNYSAQIQLGNAYLELGGRSSVRKAVELFEGLQENPSRTIVREALTGLALAFLAEEDFEGAQEQFNRILSLPNLSAAEQAEIYVNIGNAYLKQGQEKLARENYEKAMALDASLPEAHYNLGRLYQLEKRFADARRKYIMAYGYEPNLAPAHYNMGVLYDQQGDLEQAAKEYRAALQIDPSLGEAYLNLANLYQRQGKNEQALQLLQEAKTLTPNAKLVRDALGALYYRLGQYDQAKAELDYPNPTAQALLLRGILHFHEEQYAEAVTQLRAALKEEASQPRPATLVNLGAALVKIGNYPDAERYLEQALNMRRDWSDTYNALAALYVGTGRYDEAEQALERSLALKPEQSDIQGILEQIRALT